MNLLTPTQCDRIVANVRKVVSTGDINFLNMQAYNFIMLSSGFIAHYNIHGFMDAYGDGKSLATAICNNSVNNRWMNFSPRDRDYDYYMQKRDLYARLVEICRIHRPLSDL